VPRIRSATPKDAAAIRRIHLQAFGRSAEADIVAALVAANAVSLSLLAEHDGEVVGHILFSPVTIEREAVPVIGLAPMAVLPGWQRRGVGSALVRASLDELRRIGCDAVVVLGHPAFYPRFGFAPASRHGLRWEHE